MELLWGIVWICFVPLHAALSASRSFLVHQLFELVDLSKKPFDVVNGISDDRGPIGLLRHVKLSVMGLTDCILIKHRTFYSNEKNHKSSKK